MFKIVFEILAPAFQPLCGDGLRHKRLWYWKHSGDETLESDSSLKFVCPVCRNRYAESVCTDFCPEDGALLEALAEEALPVIDKYKIVRELARGGWGTVYLAEHLVLGKQFALKIVNSGLSKVQQERFGLEARALSQLSHPGIVSIVDYGLTPRPFMVMELAAGDTLETLLAEKGTLSPAAVASIFFQLAEALESCAERGVIHRDIKPSNIMVTEVSGRQAVKILDFGLARQESGDKTLSSAGETLGTPSYMSPEQCQGRALTPQTDVYSLGCVIYECLSGRKAVEAQEPTTAFYNHIHESPARIPYNDELAMNLEKLTFQCLEKSPEQRPTASSLRSTLYSLLNPATSRQSFKKYANVFLNIGLTIAVLLLAGFASQYWFSESARDSKAGNGAVDRSMVTSGSAQIHEFNLELPPQASNSPLIVIVATGSGDPPIAPTCKRLHELGMATVVLNVAHSSDSCGLLQELKQHLAGAESSKGVVDLESMGIVFISPDNLSGVLQALKEPGIRSGIVINPVVEKSDSVSIDEFKSVVHPVMYIVDDSAGSSKNRGKVLRECQRAFLYAKATQIILDVPGRKMWNKSGEPSSPEFDTAEKFLKAFTLGDRADRAFLLSARALNMLGADCNYKWRITDKN